MEHRSSRQCSHQELRKAEPDQSEPRGRGLKQHADRQSKHREHTDPSQAQESKGYADIGGFGRHQAVDTSKHQPDGEGHSRARLAIDRKTSKGDYRRRRTYGRGLPRDLRAAYMYRLTYLT